MGFSPSGIGVSAPAEDFKEMTPLSRAAPYHHSRLKSLEWTHSIAKLVPFRLAPSSRASHLPPVDDRLAWEELGLLQGPEVPNFAEGEVVSRPGESVDARQSLGKLIDKNQGNRFLDLPVDVFFEIAFYLKQRDLLALCQTSKQLRTVLVSPITNQLWFSLRAASGVPSPNEIPGWNQGKHERFSAMILDPLGCNVCGKARNCTRFYAIRVAMCRDCTQATFSSASSLAGDVEIHPKAFQCSTPYILPSLGRDPQYFRPHLLAISKRLFEFIPLSEEMAPEDLERQIDVDMYESEEVTKAMEQSALDKKLNSFMKEKRLESAELVMREQGWSEKDFTPEWKAMLRNFDPVIAQATPLPRFTFTMFLYGQTLRQFRAKAWWFPNESRSDLIVRFICFFAQASPLFGSWEFYVFAVLLFTICWLAILFFGFPSFYVRCAEFKYRRYRVLLDPV